MFRPRRVSCIPCSITCRRICFILRIRYGGRLWACSEDGLFSSGLVRVECSLLSSDSGLLNRTRRSPSRPQRQRRDAAHAGLGFEGPVDLVNDTNIGAYAYGCYPLSQDDENCTGDGVPSVSDSLHPFDRIPLVVRTPHACHTYSRAQGYQWPQSDPEPRNTTVTRVVTIGNQHSTPPCLQPCHSCNPATPSAKASHYVTTVTAPGLATDRLSKEGRCVAVCAELPFLRGV